MSSWSGVVEVEDVAQSVVFFCFLMIRRPPGSTQSRSSAASDVYKRQFDERDAYTTLRKQYRMLRAVLGFHAHALRSLEALSLIHISEPTRPY